MYTYIYIYIYIHIAIHIIMLIQFYRIAGRTSWLPRRRQAALRRSRATPRPRPCRPTRGPFRGKNNSWETFRGVYLISKQLKQVNQNKMRQGPHWPPGGDRHGLRHARRGPGAQGFQGHRLSIPRIGYLVPRMFSCFAFSRLAILRIEGCLNSTL